MPTKIISHARRVEEFRRLISRGKPKLAERAVKELGNLGHEAIPVLRGVLASGSPWQRLHAIDAIVKIKPQPSVGLIMDLRRIADKYHVEAVRNAAADAIEQLLRNSKTRP